VGAFNHRARSTVQDRINKACIVFGLVEWMEKPRNHKFSIKMLRFIVTDIEVEVREFEFNKLPILPCITATAADGLPRWTKFSSL
jgi:hypothetical protein